MPDAAYNRSPIDEATDTKGGVELTGEPKTMIKDSHGLATVLDGGIYRGYNLQIAFSTKLHRIGNKIINVRNAENRKNANDCGK